MRLAKIIAAAGLAVAAVTGATAASAQEYRGDRVRHDLRYEQHHRWDRHHQVCRTEWRHHHRVTVCYRR